MKLILLFVRLMSRLFQILIPKRLLCFFLFIYFREYLDICHEALDKPLT